MKDFIVCGLWWNIYDTSQDSATSFVVTSHFKKCELYVFFNMAATQVICKLLQYL